MTAETIRVTADHIKRGEPQDSEKCPIALAMKEQRGDYVDVDGCHAWYHPPGNDGGALTADLPEEARKFVDRFDHGDETAGPFEFTVEWRDPEGDE
jgi:hypothetical protein